MTIATEIYFIGFCPYMYKDKFIKLKFTDLHTNRSIAEKHKVLYIWEFKNNVLKYIKM